MGEAKKRAFRVRFDSKLKLEFHGAKVTSDAGLLAYRELDDVFGLTEIGAAHLFDPRRGRNTQHSNTALARQSIFGRLGGYKDTNDADRMRFDPAMRYVVGGRAREKLGASSSEMSRFETEILTRPENLEVLMDMSGWWIDRVRDSLGMSEVILDMDSSESPTHGHQEGSAFNGYFGCTCYHPLFLFNQYGDLERSLLREGNVHSAHDWLKVLEPVVTRYRAMEGKKYFRGDAAFAILDLLKYLEAEGYFYAIRIPLNNVLQEHIGHLMTRPVGRPSYAPKVIYYSFQYQAKSWDKPR